MARNLVKASVATRWPVAVTDAAAGERIADRALVRYARGFEHPAKIRLLQWLIRRWARPINMRYAGGARITVDPADHIGWAILRSGSFEVASLDLALRIIKATPGLFIDVGANVGWYSCALSGVCGVTVVSIEPDPANAETLRANLARNGRVNATVIEAAAGPCEGTVRMVRRAPGNSGTATVVMGRAGKDGDSVNMLPLETMLRRAVDPPQRPVLMKIDVEGFEPQVLAGLDFGGPFRPRNIIMELEPAFASEAWGSLIDIETFFSARDYRLCDVFGRDLRSIDEIPETNIWASDR